MASTVLEVVDNVLKTVKIAINIGVNNVYLFLDSIPLPNLVANALQNVCLASIQIFATNVNPSMVSSVPEVVAHALNTVYPVICLPVPNVHISMALPLMEIVVRALRTVWIAIIIIIAANVQNIMASTSPEVVAYVLQTVNVVIVTYAFET
jgi:hypothetical protein